MASLLRSSIFTVVLLCELVVFMDKVTAQTFIANPASIVELSPGQEAYGMLSCTYTRTASSDVIGWVVNGIRITDGTTKRPAAIESALGPTANEKMQVLENEVSPGSESWLYDIDFFSVTEVLNGEYKCQLCTDTTCGTVIEESTTAQVRVEYEPTTPPTCRPASATRVILGESVTLYCSSDPGVPTVQLEWLRNTEAMSGQGQPVLSDGVLYHNHTFVPGVSDDDPGVTFTCRRTGATTTATCSIASFILVSTPQVIVVPPSEGITPGTGGTYTCSASSETNTAIVSYNWIVAGVDSSRLTYSNGGRSVTIEAITADDHEKVVVCEATDAENMKGSGQYPILVEGQVIPSNLPTVPPILSTEMNTGTTTPVPTSLPTALPLAAIIAIAVVGFILLCIIFGGIWFFQSKKKKSKHTLPPTIVKNDLSPSPYKPEKPFDYANHSEAKQPDPDVIPRGPNERPVDVDDADWWKESGAPHDQMPLKQVNIPVQSMGSNAHLEDPYKYDPAYDDKADPTELDYKVPLGDSNYGDGYGYPDGNYGYPDDYGKKYNDMHYSEDGYDKQNYSDRPYGDGSYTQGYGDDYNRDVSNYDTVYGDGYDPSAPPYSNSYDQYPDRMPDGSEGYEPPPPEGYNDQAYDGYSAPTDYGRPDDYSGVGDYGHPNDYSGQPDDYSSQPNDYDSQPLDMGYGDQPAGYDDRPSDYDYHHPSSSTLPDGYHEGMYDDQYKPPYDPDRIPDGGVPDNDGYDKYNYPPESEPYGDGYSNEPAGYDNEAGYDMNYQQYGDEYQGAGQPQGEPYYDPAEEVSATSNPSYV